MARGVFNKALLKIFIVSLIVISLMFASNYYIYKSSMDAMFKQAEANNNLVVKGIIQSFEESFKEINSTIYTVGTLPYRVYDEGGHSNLDMKNAYLLMKNIGQLITQDYVHDFVVFFRDSDLVLTLNGTESFESVFSKKYKNSKYAPEYWKNFAATSHPMKIIPADNYTNEWSSSGKTVKSLLAIVSSNQISSSVNNIVVFLDLSLLFKKVNKQSMMQGSSLIILDKDKNVILSTDEGYEVEGLESVFFESGNEITYQKGSFNYYCIKSEYNSFIYINKFPYSYEGVLSTAKVNKMILLWTTIAGLLISLALSMYIYRPVKKLISLVGIKDEERNENHFKHLYNRIEKMQQENKLINSRMDNVREEVMRSIFFKMIDDITFYKDMKDQIDTYFKVIFSSRQFLMVAFDLETPGSNKNNSGDNASLMHDEIAKEIKKALERISNISVVVFYLEKMQLIALVGVNEQVKREALLKEIRSARDWLQDTALSNYSVSAVVSKFYTEAQSCKEAFENIRMCFSYRSIKNRKPVIDLEQNNYSYDIYMPLDFNEKIFNYILSGNTAESLSLIKQIIDTNIEKNVSYIKFQYMINSVFNDIVNILVYLNADREEILDTEMEFRRITGNNNHYEEITAFFMELVEHTTERIRVENQSKLNKEYILQYINLHYAEDLYLDKMAEMFDTSPKYFSYFFKKAFGVNFVEYLNKIRMSHAKEMLKNSEIPVSEVGERLGYLSSSSFASIFRKYCGVTPTEFRKEFRAGN